MGCHCGWDPALLLLWLWHRLAAAAPIQPLAWELPYATGAAIKTIAKTWKQPKCPLTDDWIRKMWYIYTMEYYSAIKKNAIMPFAATWMDRETLIVSEAS